MAETEKSTPLRISIPEQGVEESFADSEQLAAFFDREVQFYNSEQAMADAQFRIVNMGLNEVRIRSIATTELSQIARAIRDAKFENQLADYIQRARDLKIVVGSGIIGQRIQSLSKEGRTHEARMAAVIGSSAWTQGQDMALEFIGFLRAAWLISPAQYTHVNLSNVDRARADAAQSVKTSLDAQARLEQFIEQKTRLFSELEQLYRQQLVLEEPAVLWTNVARSKTWAWRAWLFVFAVLVISPFVIAVRYHDIVIPAIVQLTGTATGGISLSGLVAVSVPAGFYAWLLKNVSRVFLQNLNLSDDAQHRRSLALTYLGLAVNPNLDVSEQDRALILSALFRPIPPHTTDEGPPSGVLDLLRKKE